MQVHQTREEREAIFTGTVGRIVSEGGRCLIPVFALGRAQVRKERQRNEKDKKRGMQRVIQLRGSVTNNLSTPPPRCRNSYSS